ncbi:hypothetical protein D3Z39_11135 [Anaerotruncus colihominis]|uniref:Uncharacterized protein n=1 Tax=Anaerotruncus colihominis TaxID=169435 RepID=A0A845RH75_9FIRM|nr:hypothetical protein [Anaerotruncus colihominis]
MQGGAADKVFLFIPDGLIICQGYFYMKDDRENLQSYFCYFAQICSQKFHIVHFCKTCYNKGINK